MIIGIILGLIGIIHKNGKMMFKTTMKAFILTTIIALLTGITGLIYGNLFLTKNRPNWYLPENLIDFDKFIMVGSMHNFSYLGSLIGLIIGIIYSISGKKEKTPYNNGYN